MKEVEFHPAYVTVGDERFLCSRSIETVQNATDFFASLPRFRTNKVVCLDEHGDELKGVLPYTVVRAVRLESLQIELVDLPAGIPSGDDYDESLPLVTEGYPCQYVTLSGFDTYLPGHLILRRGCVVTVHGKRGRWLIGSCRGRSGRFPHTKIMELPEAHAEAAKGNSAALFEIGVRYHFAYGVPADYEEGLKCFRRAAELGLARAQHNYGWCLTHGEGVALNIAEGLAWYRLAARSGHAGAQYSLGMCYVEGTGVPKDPALGVKWLLKAAEQGYPRAQQQIADNYYAGTASLPHDPDAAFKWCTRATESGLASAQCTLGYFYENGVGTACSPEMAINWYRAAAEQGDVTGMYNLAQSYNSGRGVEQDVTEAAYWHMQAGAVDKDSRAILATLFGDLKLTKLL